MKENPPEVLDWVAAEDLAAVASFYQDVGYGVGVDPGDRILTARIDKKVVGAVRICREESTQVLRGMYVAPDLRGKGVGSRLLEAVVSALDPVACWCVPYAHLREFYARGGFEECSPEQAPGFLGARARRYLKSGNRVIIMRRGHGSERL